MENEDLQIASCSIADLTIQQVNSFLEQWNPGSSIGTLTLFYELKTGLLVLNRDNKYFEFYKTLAEKYMLASEAERRTLAEKAPESFKETFQILDSCICHRKIDGEILKAEQNIVASKDRTVLDEIRKRYPPILAVLNAFCYGVMQGKRIERAKRKKGTAA